MAETTGSKDEAGATIAQPAASAQVPPDASAAKDRDEWLAIIDQIGEEAGYFEPLGPRHWAFFHDDGQKLLVTFETVEEIRARPGQMPLGHGLATARGWSHLCLISEGRTWYRDRRVYGCFDRLIDDAFFEDFEQVIFLGAGAEAYAAAAYSVAAPGATVLLVTPRATQRPDSAGWDRRDMAARRLDFRSRYGYAPDMIEGAARVFVLHDPDVAEDAMHAALFRGPHVTHLTTPHLGGRLAWAFGHMNIWDPLVDAAAEGRLSVAGFARIWRARRNFGPYLRGLLGLVAAKGKIKREKWLCTGVVARLNAPTFRKRLNEILATEAEAEATAALADLVEDGPKPGR